MYSYRKFFINIELQIFSLIHPFVLTFYRHIYMALTKLHAVTLMRGLARASID